MVWYIIWIVIVWDLFISLYLKLVVKFGEVFFRLVCFFVLGFFLIYKLYIRDDYMFLMNI